MSGARITISEVGATAEASVAARPPVIFVVMQTGMRANGGVESITHVLKRLRRVRPIVVTQMETPASREWREAGCEVRVWPEVGWAGSRGEKPRAKLGRLVSLVRANLRVRRLVRESGCRVVHCNDILALWHSAFGARSAGASVVFNIRNIKPAGQRYGWRWSVARRISDRQLVLSREMREAIAERLGIRGRGGVEFIYSIIEADGAPAVGREEARARLGIGADCFAVGYVAAFDERKAQLDLIESAAGQLKEAVPSARLFFIGDFDPEGDVYARECREAVRRLGLQGSVTFVGFVPAVADWYRALDVVIVASRNEGLARCMIESLANGTPVVSFDVCSAREILEGHECGTVVPQGDYRALVEGVARMAADDDRRRLGENGARVARALFDADRVTGRYESLYASLLAADAGARPRSEGMN